MHTSFGNWEGTIEVGFNPLPFCVTFSTASGAPTGTIDVKLHKAT